LQPEDEPAERAKRKDTNWQAILAGIHRRSEIKNDS